MRGRLLAMELATISAALRDVLAAREEVACAYLFGSLARGEGGASSDVDVAVLLEQDPPRTLAGVPARLEAELSRRASLPVDVVILNRAPLDLVHRVLRDGRLLVDHNPTRRIAFEVRARNLYWDLEPVLRRYRYRDAPTR